MLQGEVSKKESLMEESFLQNPSEMVSNERDEIKGHLEELDDEAEDEEEESSEELEDDPEENSVQEVEQKQLEETTLDPGLYKKLREVPCYEVPDSNQLSLYYWKDDQSGEPFEDLSEVSLLKQSSGWNELDKNDDGGLNEEAEQKQLKETILDPELDTKFGEASVNEGPVCSPESFYKYNHGQTQELFDELSEVSVSFKTSDRDCGKCDHKSGPVKQSNDKKRCQDVASGTSTPVPCYQSQKKCKQGGSLGPKAESVPSGLELNNDSVTAGAPIDKSASKEGGTGSSGKRRHNRWEQQPDGDQIKDYQICKRRKTRWSSDNTQIKMMGPLQLPDITKDFLVEYEKDPEFQGLKAELLEINRQLQRPLNDDRPEEERSPSPEPIYNDLGIRINTREIRFCQKLVQKRQNIISKFIKSNPTFKPPSDYKPPKLFKKLYLPVKQYPEYNFVGLIIGPRGNTQKRMENETGAKILLRGKGFSKTPSKSSSGKEDLHVYIEADNKKSLDAAVVMVEKLLIPIEGRNEHKKAQLKELAMLNGTVDENLCSFNSDEGHWPYACPSLGSTIKMNSCDTCGLNSHLKLACPSTLSTQNDSVLSSGFGFSLSSTQNRQKRPEKKAVMNNLYVGNLPQAIDGNRLCELFSPFGKITEAKIIKDRATGSSRGYGFVKFENAMDAAAAVIHLNGLKLDGRVLKVSIAGLLSHTESLDLNVLPKHSWLTGTSENIPSRTDCSGPLHFMLPSHQTSLHDCSGMNMFSSIINSRYGGLKKDLGFTPPSYTSSPSDFGNSSNMHFSCNFTDQSLFSSGT